MIKKFFESKLGTIPEKVFNEARYNRKYEIKHKYLDFGIHPRKGTRIAIMERNIEFFNNRQWAL